MASPLFSVIIPLEEHRGQWDLGLKAWQAQTIDKSDFEIILVVPPAFPEKDQLREIFGNTRIEYGDESHDVALCVLGAARARGDLLFFTESHCWPEPDVLELCCAAFKDNPGWAGLSCCSIGVTHNRLSKAEARMYQTDIEFGLGQSSWRKILDQCFATRREIYEASGGFRSELGHFSEWAMAAKYHELGYEIGYLHEASVHHYYIGELGELKGFTQDFTDGEMLYFDQDQRNVLGVVEPPTEWVCQGNFDREIARSMLATVAKAALRDNRPLGQRLRAVWRWLVPAITEDCLPFLRSWLLSCLTSIGTRLALAVGSSSQIDRGFRAYIGALVAHQRLKSRRLTRKRSSQRQSTPRRNLIFDVRNTGGFYSLEQFEGKVFRWSEPAAGIRLQANAGDQIIRIRCLAVRDLREDLGLYVYIDGSLLEPEAVKINLDSIDISVCLPQTRIVFLSWECRNFSSRDDIRLLGLPIFDVSLTGGEE